VSLTAERLKELLHYDPGTGVFTWNARTGRQVAGQVAGTVNLGTRIQIKIDGRTYKAHRLAWLYVHGQWPRGAIDHIDGSALNNAIANLRECTMSQNQANKRRRVDNASGFKGVYLNSDRKVPTWIAEIRQNGRKIHLGTFKSPEEAHRAYVEAAERIYGEFARAA
jgi:hypothetical protein